MASLKRMRHHQKSAGLLWAAKRAGIGLLVLSIAALTDTRHQPTAALRPDRPAAEICQPVSSATFIAVGDIMLSRGVERAITRSGDHSLPFSGLEDELGSTDFNFGNLESPVSGNDARYGEGLVFNTHSRDMEGVFENNFQVVSLANNHALDQGVKGLEHTVKFLADRGVAGVGVGNTLEEAWRPRIVEVRGIRIAFVSASYASVNDGGVARNQYVARTDDIESLATAIRQARANSDIVIATMHAGIEYTRHPDRQQIAFARAAIDNGAAMVIGSHPHWVQITEQYKGKQIFYSLGNFIFDQRQPGTTNGLILRVTVSKRSCGSGAVTRTYLNPTEAIPVVIEVGGIPHRDGVSRSFVTGE